MARYHGTANHIYMNGAFVPEARAKVDVLSCAVKYGATVFEGLRGCSTAAAGALLATGLRLRKRYFSR